MTTPETTSETITSVFQHGKWVKLGSNMLTLSGASVVRLNDIVNVGEKNAETQTLTTIDGRQQDVKKAAMSVLREPEIFSLVPICVGEKFRVPREADLKTMGIDIPKHLEENLTPGAIIRVVDILHKGSMIEVSFKNGRNFCITPEVLSKFPKKKASRKNA